MKTKTEIIQETVAYYSEDPSRRAAHPDDKTCEFLTEDGRMCAVGRCSNKLWLEDWTEKFGKALWQPDIESVLDNMQPEYQGHDIDFWSELQLFHDREANWTKDGITPRGEEYIRELLETYQ